jgi:DNA-directed RNA polymerase specialized sigma24 family protein
MLDSLTMAYILESTASLTDLEVGREQFFSDLYERVFPSVAKFICKQHGSLDDAKDVFHDALIIFYEKKTAGKLEISLTNEAYVFGIVKHLWIKRSKEQQGILFTEMESFINIPSDFDTTPDTTAIVTFLKSAGVKCMALLQAFYYQKKPLDLIKSTFGFSSVRSATVQKFKCLEKIRDNQRRCKS